MVLKKPTSIGCRHLREQIKHRILQKEYVTFCHAKIFNADKLVDENLNMAFNSIYCKSIYLD